MKHWEPAQRHVTECLTARLGAVLAAEDPENWWRDFALTALNDNQRATAARRGSSSLDDLDLAALVSVAIGNADRLKAAGYGTQALVRRLHAVKRARNEHAHAPASGMPLREAVRYLQSCLDLFDELRWTDAARNDVTIARLEAAAQELASRGDTDLRVAYCRDFTNSLNRLHKLGARRREVWTKAQRFINDLVANPQMTIDQYKTTQNDESRIRSAVQYDMGQSYQLVTIQKDKCFFVCFVGSHEETDDWLNRNRGLEPVVDGSYVEFVHVSRNGDTPAPREAQPFEGALLDRLPVETQDQFLDLLPGSAVRSITALRGDTLHPLVQEAASRIGDPDLMSFASDVLASLVAGDRAGAIRLIKLRTGEIAEFDDASDEALSGLQGGAGVRIFDAGSTEQQEFLRLLATEGDHIEWLLYLHPEQKQVVDEDFPASAQLSGVSGSGKTCIAVHRAVRLAERSTTARVLLVTLNRSLADMIRGLVSVAAQDAAIRDRVEVRSFFELCREKLVAFEPNGARRFDSVTWKNGEHVDEIFREYYRCWTNNGDAGVLQDLHRLLVANGINAEAYLREEFDWIRSALQEGQRNQYLTLPREGRRHPIQEASRRQVLSGLEGWERKMEAVGVIDYLGLTTALTRHVDRLRPEWDHIVVDEAQDFGTTELAMLRRLAKEGPDDMFLCGDIAQHVLPKHRNLRAAGITISPRASRRITVNYRNTRQILEAAYAVLLEDLDETSLDEGKADLEILDPVYSNREGNLPIVFGADCLEDEIAFALSEIADVMKGDPDARCCLAIAGYSLKEIAEFAELFGANCLGGERDAAKRAGLVFSDLEQTKGYEFDHITIVNCCSNVLPARDAPPEEVHRDCCRLYVAMTRAKNDLRLSYHGRPSRWLEAASKRLGFERWGDTVAMDPAQRRGLPLRLAATEDPGASPLTLTGVQFCYMEAALGLSTDAQEKLCELVDGRGLLEAGGRARRKWRSVGEALADLRRSPDARRRFGPKVSEELLALGDEASSE